MSNNSYSITVNQKDDGVGHVNITFRQGTNPGVTYGNTTKFSFRSPLNLIGGPRGEDNPTNGHTSTIPVSGQAYSNALNFAQRQAASTATNDGYSLMGANCVNFVKDTLGVAGVTNDLSDMLEGNGPSMASGYAWVGDTADDIKEGVEDAVKSVADYFGIGNDDNIDADDATKGKYEGSLDSAEQSYKDYTRPKNTGSSGSSSTDDDDSSKDTGKMAGVMGCPIVLDLDGAVSPSGVASHEPLPIISGAALGGDEVVIHSLSLSRVASSSPTQTILRVA